jgi:segregation and condensation protein B
MENTQETTTFDEMTRIEYTWDLDQDNSEEKFELELDYFDEKEQEDKLWQARTGLNYDTLCGAIETLIFMSDKPISLQKLRSQIDEDLPLRVVHESLERLMKEYEQKHHGIRLMEVAEGYQFRTKATYSKFVQDLFKVNSLVLSPTALEVLAIIAYKQPISKTDIDKIRGVDGSHIVRALMDKRLVKIVGRSEELGRPSLYGTSLEFLEVFNLSDISELPPEYELEEIAQGEAVGEINEIKTIVSGGDREKYQFDEIEELDELSKSIKDIKPETDFIKTLKSEDKKRTSPEGEIVKSAFDILEDFIRKDESVGQNIQASESEVLMTTADVKPVNLAELFSGEVFNAPEESEDEDMTLSEEEVIEHEDTTVSEQVKVEGLELEAMELEKALDDAFERLQAGVNVPSVEESMEAIDQKTDEAAKKALELDIDLNFLQENEASEENNPSDDAQ